MPNFFLFFRRLAEFVSTHNEISVNTATATTQSTKCQPKQKIVFHKTHKCSSTTVQNILFRFMKKNELHPVLPNKGNFLGQTEGFTVNFHAQNSQFHKYFKVSGTMRQTTYFHFFDN